MSIAYWELPVSKSCGQAAPTVNATLGTFTGRELNPVMVLLVLRRFCITMTGSTDSRSSRLLPRQQPHFLGSFDLYTHNLSWPYAIAASWRHFFPVGEACAPHILPMLLRQGVYPYFGLAYLFHTVRRVINQYYFIIDSLSSRQ